MTALLSLLTVGIGLGLLLAAASRLHRQGVLAAETARKVVHAALGLSVASFPALFTRLWPVWLFAGLMVSVLLAVRRHPALRQVFGGALHAVERTSWGDLLFPIAVALCWSLAPADWIRFSLPILVLALADALAALVGRSYGRLTYTSADHPKTWEGSLAFALVTFLLVEIPLLLGTELGRAACLLIALNLAVLLMLVEALAWEGSDNLLIPLVGLVALDRWLPLTLDGLLQTTAALLLMAIACWAARRWTTLNDAAVLACVVIGYATWALGGLSALLAPWTVFLSYQRLYPPEQPEHGHPALIPVVIALPSLGWLWFSEALPPGAGTLAAAAAYAIQLGAIGLIHGLYRPSGRRWTGVVLQSWAVSQALVLLPSALISAWEAGGGLLEISALASLLALPVLLLFAWWQPHPARFPVGAGRWLRQSILAALGSAVVLGLSR